MRMFSNQKEGSKDSYEVWKAERHCKVDRKRKKDVEEVELEQNTILAGKQKLLRLNLSSSGNIDKNLTFKTNMLTCYSDRGLRGDAGDAGEAVLEGGQGVHGGDKEVTVEDITVQRAGLGEQLKSGRL